MIQMCLFRAVMYELHAIQLKSPMKPGKDIWTQLIIWK